MANIMYWCLLAVYVTYMDHVIYIFGTYLYLSVVPKLIDTQNTFVFMIPFI